MATKTAIQIENEKKARDAKQKADNTAQALSSNVNTANPSANSKTVSAGQTAQTTATSSLNEQKKTFNQPTAEQTLSFLNQVPQGGSLKEMMDALHPRTPEELLEQRTKEKKKIVAMNRLSTLSEGLRLISDTVGGFNGGDVYKRNAPLDTSAQEAQSQQNYSAGLQNIQNNRMAVAMKEYETAQANRNTALQAGLGKTTAQTGSADVTGESTKASAGVKPNTSSSYNRSYNYGNGGSKTSLPLLYKTADGKDAKFVFKNKDNMQSSANQAMNNLSSTDKGKEAIHTYVENHLEELKRANTGDDIFVKAGIEAMNPLEQVEEFNKALLTIFSQGTSGKKTTATNKQTMAIYQNLLQNQNTDLIDFTNRYLGLPKVDRGTPTTTTTKPTRWSQS